MNELRIDMPVGWMYYKTPRENAADAFEEFVIDIENIGVNLDNVKIVLCILRDEDGNDIDRYYSQY